MTTPTTASRTFWANVRGGLPSIIFATCWVIVDPPSTTRSRRTSCTTARATAMGSTPGCRSNRRSSAAIVARATLSGTSASHSRRVPFAASGS